jgi:cation diffusion facilitator family transporter
MVTLSIGLVLAGVGLFMAYGAIKALSPTAVRLPAWRPSTGPAVWAALAVALASIASKEWLYRWTAARGTALKSSALVANAWHHRSDALSSIPSALTVGGCAAGAHLGLNLWYLDPVGTVVVAVMIIAAAWNIVKPTLNTLMDASADRRLGAAIHETVAATPGVMSGHKLRTRFLGSGAAEVNIHILVDGGLTVAEGHRIAADVKYRLLDLAVPNLETRIVDVLIHIEPGGEP